MPTWFIIIVVLAAAGILYTLYQRGQLTKQPEQGQKHVPAERDYPKEREEARLAHLSEDDRAWEAASLQRNLASQTPSEAPAEQRP